MSLEIAVLHTGMLGDEDPVSCDLLCLGTSTLTLLEMCPVGFFNAYCFHLYF